MATRRLGIVGTVVVLGILIYGTVAVAMAVGLVTHAPSHAAASVLTIGKAPETSTNAPAAVMNDAQGSSTSTSGSAGVASSSLAYPYPGTGAFQPGPPPNFNGGLSGDGLSAWGVAFKQSSDPKAEVDAALIKSAYQDAQKRAQELASATGVSLGKLVAMSDYTNAQPYFAKPCFQPAIGVPGIQGKPAAPPSGAPGGGSSRSGSSGSGTIVEPAPVPVPAPCSQDRYLVAWVVVRYSLA